MLESRRDHHAEHNQSALAPEHYEIEGDPTKCLTYLEMLERTLGGQVRVARILEGESHVKREAGPTSKIDAGAYISSGAAYAFHISTQLTEAHHEGFLGKRGLLPRLGHNWAHFNDGVSRRARDRRESLS